MLAQIHTNTTSYYLKAYCGPENSAMNFFIGKLVYVTV